MSKCTSKGTVRCLRTPTHTPTLESPFADHLGGWQNGVQVTSFEAFWRTSPKGWYYCRYTILIQPEPRRWWHYKKRWEIMSPLQGLYLFNETTTIISTLRVYFMERMLNGSDLHPTRWLCPLPCRILTKAWRIRTLINTYEYSIVRFYSPHLIEHT